MRPGILYCNTCQKSGHGDSICWELHPELVQSATTRQLRHWISREEGKPDPIRNPELRVVVQSMLDKRQTLGKETY